MRLIDIFNRQSLCVLFLLVLCSCSKDPASVSGNTMGTSYTVKIVGITSQDLAAVEAEIAAELIAINAAMSTYQSDSVISRFNRSGATSWFDVPQNFVEVANAALLVAQQSGGAFDPTVGPLVRQWGFGADDAQQLPPSDSELEQLLAFVGHTQVEIRMEPPAIRKKVAQLELDFSAIAKGYAVDQLALIIESHGIDDYLVEIGGELRVSGDNADGEPWRVGVEYPDADGVTVQSGLLLNSGGVASSGDYRNYRQIGDTRYSHIIDPRSGAPVTHNLAAVTVVADSAMLADAWATALMVLGAEQGRRISESKPLAALLVQREAEQFIVQRSELFSQLRTAAK